MASVIHNPISGDGAIAVRGQGAWIQEPNGAGTGLRSLIPGPCLA
jgi:fructose-1,6-bisphosphatase/inositol monophosphatase family enzyme